MPFCPRCKAEYVPGITACADCGVALVDHRPAPDQPQEIDGDLAAVYEAPDQFMAATVESLLRHEGISAVTRSRQMPMYDGLAMMQHPVWGTVLVLERDAERAREIVEEYLRSIPTAEDDTDEEPGQ
ncbi:MAG: DUF2007 domain-containing protein [Candidatus Edwardsbacteria bacterium]|nr:DUF2007 domain-containing protein [Candidatus Edwardsbacteria bacterium]